MIAELLDRLRADGASVAVAESLTGGLLASSIVAVPGASDVFRGGIVAYATDVKASALGVPAPLLATQGPVDPQVAAAMALGVAERMTSDLGLATTGVAGPDSQDGKTPGTGYVAVYDRRSGEELVKGLSLAGDRNAVRAQAVTAAVDLLVEYVSPKG